MEKENKTEKRAPERASENAPEKEQQEGQQSSLDGLGQQEEERKSSWSFHGNRGVFVIVIAILIVGSLTISYRARLKKEARLKEQARVEELICQEEKKNQQRKDAVVEAEKIAEGYDYDKAIEMLMSLEHYQQDNDIMSKIEKFQDLKTKLLPVNMMEIPHIYYHSLVVDPEIAFAGEGLAVNGIKQWMTTVNEFENIMQAMYDNGYVLVNLHDLVEKTTDEQGNVSFTKGQIMLPEGKRPFLMTVEDDAYLHKNAGRGMASRLKTDKDGKLVSEYIQPDGTVKEGDYDCVTLLEAFIEKHPDAAYQGARGTMCLTGYNGILGYRTDPAYKTGENLQEDQQEWLNAHPNFDWDQEVKEAKKTADAMKEAGWTFASQTWGNIRVGGAELPLLMEDTEKWKASVEPLVGETDIIMFPYGEDIGDWHDYSQENEKFNYLKSQGYDYFCNVDASQYFLQIRSNYVRQGRRSMGGYRLWYDVHGSKNRTEDLFDASGVLDPVRTEMPDL